MADPVQITSYLPLPAPGGAPPPTEERLKTEDGGGTFIPMEPASKEYVDLKLDALMSRIDGKFDLMNQRLGDLEKSTPSIWKVAAVVWSGFLGVIAVLAFAGDRFDGGVGLADQRQEQMQRDAEQDAIIKRLDALLAAQTTQPAPSPESPSE